VIGAKPIAVESQSISNVNAVNLFIVFYDIHRRKGAILLFYPGHHTRLWITLETGDITTMDNKL
jgi:hypothetical protein